MDHILSSKRKDAPVKHSPVLLLKLPKASVDVEGPTKVALPLLVAVLSRTRLFTWDREPRQNILHRNVGARDFDPNNGSESIMLYRPSVAVALSKAIRSKRKREIEKGTLMNCEHIILRIPHQANKEFY